MIAKQIVGSSLVKTAIYGEDANWGRIISAIGQTKTHVNPETVDISIGPIEMLKSSEPVAFSEEKALQYLNKILSKYLFICIMVKQSEKLGAVIYPMII